VESIAAHRGFSARHPEATRAAYQEVIAWSESSGIPVSLECDVHFSSDGALICLHDLTVDRTSNGTGLASDHTLAELRELDFGSWRVPDPTPAQRALVTLEEVLTMVREARDHGVPVSVAIETKHPNSRGTEIEEEVALLLRRVGWDRAGSPVRIISFSVAGLAVAGRLLPELERTLLVEIDLEPVSSGELPEGVRIVSPDVRLLRQDPEFVARAQAHGNQVHVWTVNTPADLDFCRSLGATGYTTDDPELVASGLGAA
jgi:glycerophosphoryl diester phosphodiesterase